jgi:hypothetical protein
MRKNIKNQKRNINPHHIQRKKVDFGGRKTMINIGRLKKDFTSQFPDSSLTAVLLQEKDYLSAEELLAKVGTWLAILNANKKK